MMRIRGMRVGIAMAAASAMMATAASATAASATEAPRFGGWVAEKAPSYIDGAATPRPPTGDPVPEAPIPHPGIRRVAVFACPYGDVTVDIDAVVDRWTSRSRFGETLAEEAKSLSGSTAILYPVPFDARQSREIANSGADAVSIGADGRIAAVNATEGAAGNDMPKIVEGSRLVLLGKGRFQGLGLDRTCVFELPAHHLDPFFGAPGSP